MYQFTDSCSCVKKHAVLESKWPSTNQGGRLRWAKLRNVLLAVAQFREPIRCRQKNGSVGSHGDEVKSRPHSTLIRQSSWSGLSESSSHESLTGGAGEEQQPGQHEDPRRHGEALQEDPPSGRLHPPAGPRGRLHPPAGRGDASTPPPAPPGVALVPRSQVCLSTFYKECSEAEDPQQERGGRPVSTRDSGRNKDENYNNVSSPSRGGLAGKLQQLLTPTRHRGARRAASVDERRGRGGGGGGGIVRRVSEQRTSRKSQVAETLLRAKERLVSATSESSLSVGSDVDLAETPSPAFPQRRSWDSNQEAIGLEVLISSCSLCRSCNSLVYDEEIMAGWTSDDSNLNSSCPFCGASFVPFLNAEICDLGPVGSAERGNWNVEEEVESAARPPSGQEASLRPPSGHEAALRPQCNGVSEDSSSETSSYSENSRTTTGSWTGAPPLVTVAYLSPLVLRKELESLLENEGEAVLAQLQFLDNHSIIFWNLLWYFQRLGLPSNLLQLVRASPLASSFTQSDSSAVRVRLLWDTLTPDTDLWPPLYILWRIHSGVQMRSHGWRRHSHPFTLSFLEEVLRWVGMNEVHKAITLFLETIAKQPGGGCTQRSLYREFLFLTMAAMGKDHVAAFDKKYKAAYSRLAGSLGRDELRRKRAQPLSPKAVDCRRSFHPPLEC
ncbi:hypothetical protein CgunFtcFv8_018981 [Champsocephalus gunnari]|uniref:DENN domain-containing protein 4B n=1 Tax=Champsocephalus gunnari TaxID=52237 RepID=A0AAN8DG51_CHAGU|nr:hypothetical protein CgunFtcFv8_018981 [Champsocephalus gunnari]